MARIVKRDKINKSQTLFENFKKFAEALVAVPKKELDEKLAKYNRQKLKRKRA